MRQQPIKICYLIRVWRFVAFVGKQIRRENGVWVGVGGGGGVGPSKMNRGEKKTNERLNSTKARVRLKCLESKR